MSKQYEIVVPFSGFYESNHGGKLDSAIDYALDPEEGRPDHIYDDLVIDLPGFYHEYAEAYLAEVVSFLETECEISLELEIKEVNSPKEYNFETDQIIAYISEEGIKAILAETNWNGLEEVVYEDLSPRSGFATSRSNKLDDWLFRGVHDWDCIELGFLLEQFITPEDLDVDLGHEIASDYITYRVTK